MSFWQWLLGIDKAPSWTAGGQWSLSFQSLPTGAWAGAGVAAVLAAVCGVCYLYRKEARETPLRWRVALASLRLSILACVTLMLLELVLVLTNTEHVPSRLLVLLDTSESLSLTDPYTDTAIARATAEQLGLKTSDGQPDLDRLRKEPRFDLATAALRQILPQLAEGRQMALYEFAAGQTALPEPVAWESLAAKGTGTALGDAVRGALVAHRGQPLAGVLVVTDGQSNTGDDPLVVAQQAGRDGVPIVALAVGTEQGPRNARLVDLEANPAVFVRDAAEISAIIESRGLNGTTASVHLEQRGSDGDWNETERRELVLGEDATLQRVVFQFTPEQVGQLDFRVRVTDVGPELTEADNLDTQSIKVIRQKIRVLLVAGDPAPEVQFLRNALLRDRGLEFASWLQSAGTGYEHPGSKPLQRLPGTQEELDYYDVLLLFDPEVSKLPPNWPELMTRFVGTAGGGLIYVAGELHAADLFAGAGEGGSEDSSWLKLLPVVRDPGLYQSQAEVQLSSREAWTLELTPTGSEDTIFHFAPDAAKNREILASLPGMYWHFPVTRAKPAATVLAQHGDPRMRNNFGRHVLLATHFYGPGRTVFVGFDSTYRWRYLDEAYFDGFWARLIDRVGRNKVLGGRYPFVLATDKASYRAGDAVQIRAEYASAGDVPPGLAVLSGELEVGDKPPVSLALEAAGDEAGLFKATFTAGEPGLHTLRVVTGAEIEIEGGPRAATLEFRVDPPRRELDRPTLNRALLEDMAHASGGKVFSLAEADQIPAAFRVKQVERVLEYRQELWDAPLLYGAVMFLLTLEWLLRKRQRMA